MGTKTAHRHSSVPASAAALSDALTSALASGGEIIIGVGGRPTTVPPSLASALIDLLDDVSEGRDVTTAPAGLPVGTELAADLLGVSRPWLTTLLDRGVLPSSRVGTKRRVRLGDLIAYRRTDDRTRRATLTWEFLDRD